MARLPPKPRIPALVSRTLVAAALTLPACSSSHKPMRIGPPPCDEYSHTEGKVLDRSNKPVANQPVTLSIEGHERIVTTDERGRFRLEGVDFPEMEMPVSASSPGYETIEVDITPTECASPGRIHVVLDPIE